RDPGSRRPCARSVCARRARGARAARSARVATCDRPPDPELGLGGEVGGEPEPGALERLGAPPPLLGDLSPAEELPQPAAQNPVALAEILHLQAQEHTRID